MAKKDRPSGNSVEYLAFYPPSDLAKAIHQDRVYVTQKLQSKGIPVSASGHARALLRWALDNSTPDQIAACYLQLKGEANKRRNANIMKTKAKKKREAEKEKSS